MKIIRYILFCLLGMLLTDCYMQSNYSKKRIPMRELSNQVDTSKQDTVWCIPDPKVLIVN